MKKLATQSTLALAALLTLAAGCADSSLELADERELPGDGDLGNPGDEVVVLELGSGEVAHGYALPYAPEEKYGVAQSPHGYSGQLYNAVDFALPFDTPVAAMRGGFISAIVEHHPDYPLNVDCVTRSCNDQTNYVVVQHGDGNESAYLHLGQGTVSQLGLSVGSMVCRGQRLGRVGHNGYSTGPHLHVSVQAGGSGGDRAQSWGELFRKATKIIDFDEVLGTKSSVARGSAPTSRNTPECSEVGDPDAGASLSSCFSSDLARWVATGECVQTQRVGCGLWRCGWQRCLNGAWSCAADLACPGASTGNAACASSKGGLRPPGGWRDGGTDAGTTDAGTPDQDGGPPPANVPQPIAPADGSEQPGPAVTLQATAVAGARSYAFEVQTRRGTEVRAYATYSAYGPTKTFYPASHGVAYLWRVRASTGLGAGGPWSSVSTFVSP